MIPRETTRTRVSQNPRLLHDIRRTLDAPLDTPAQAGTSRGLLGAADNPLFLDWSEVAITFDRDDHPDYVPNPGVYPLVVDPVIANTRLTKVLMDGGSSLNIIYAQTLTSWGLRGRASNPASGASMESC
jgi:hypothetical protein